MNQLAQDFLQFLHAQSPQISIVTHEHADFDAIGSALALNRTLKQQGFESRIFYPDPLEAALLPLIQNPEEISGSPPKASDTIIALDSSNASRIAGHQALTQPIHINIDHHADNPAYGLFNIVESISSVGELLYHLFKALDWNIDLLSANALYAAIIFDTGQFQHPNASVRTFQVAAELKSLGVKTHEISRLVFGSKPTQYFEDLKHSLNRLQFLAKERIAYLLCPHDALESSGDLMQLLQTHKDSDIFLVFKESSETVTRVSLRSKTDFNVANFAANFSGGGHAQAAGLTLQKPLAQAAEFLIEKLIEARQP